MCRVGQTNCRETMHGRESELYLRLVCPQSEFSFKIKTKTNAKFIKNIILEECIVCNMHDDLLLFTLTAYTMS